MTARPGAPVFPDLPPPHGAIEAYRNLALRLDSWLRERGSSPTVLALTSAEAGSGKTLTTLNLAVAMAQLCRHQVLLVEGDLWRPTVHRYLNFPVQSPGLVQCLRGEKELGEVALQLEGTSLEIVPAGGEGLREETVSTSGLNRLLDRERDHYDLFLLDSPPLFTSTGYSLANVSAGVVVVVGAEHTQRRDLERVLDELGPEKVIGMVFNRDPKTGGYGYSYYY